MRVDPGALGGADLGRPDIGGLALAHRGEDRVRAQPSVDDAAVTVELDDPQHLLGQQRAVQQHAERPADAPEDADDVLGDVLGFGRDLALVADRRHPRHGSSPLRLFQSRIRLAPVVEIDDLRRGADPAPEPSSAEIAHRPADRQDRVGFVALRDAHRVVAFLAVAGVPRRQRRTETQRAPPPAACSAPPDRSTSPPCSSGFRLRGQATIHTGAS